MRKPTDVLAQLYLDRYNMTELSMGNIAKYDDRVINDGWHGQENRVVLLFVSPPSFEAYLQLGVVRANFGDKQSTGIKDQT